MKILLLVASTELSSQLEDLRWLKTDNVRTNSFTVVDQAGVDQRAFRNQTNPCV